jgi:hypothetical protein
MSCAWSVAIGPSLEANTCDNIPFRVQSSVPIHESDIHFRRLTTLCSAIAHTWMWNRCRQCTAKPNWMMDCLSEFTDCWFLSSMTTVSGSPQLLQKQFIISRKLVQMIQWLIWLDGPSLALDS